MSHPDSTLRAELRLSVVEAFKSLDPALEPTFFEIDAAEPFSSKIGVTRDNTSYNGLQSPDEVLSCILGNDVEWGAEVDQTFFNLTCELSRLESHTPFALFGVTNSGQYQWMAMLRFDRTAWEKHASTGRANLPTLTEALRTIALEEIERRHRSIHDRGSFGEFTPRELLYRAAERLLFQLGNANQIDGVRTASVFHEILAISALRYERRESKARLILGPDDSPRLQVKLEAPVSLGEHRAARKVLEMASLEVPAVATFRDILGLGDAGSHAMRSLDVRFDGFHSWTLFYEGTPLVSVTAGIPRLPRGRLNEDLLRNSLEVAFLQHVDVEAILEVNRAAAMSGHGALVVICSEAATEAARLASQATLVAHTRLAPAAVGAATSIDGAVLLDTQGNCHAIGVILDGPISSLGTKARGSRYNSAIRYVQSQNGQAVAVVVSEDGYVNIHSFKRAI